MENKNKGNENKIILGDFKCTMDKMERDGRIKTLYKYYFDYALSKPIVNNRLEDLWRRENQNPSEFTHYNRSAGTRSTIDRVYTYTKTASNININHKMVSLTDHYSTIFIDRFSSKTKIAENSWYFKACVCYFLSFF